MVAFVSIVTEFLSPSTGLLADIMKFFGKEPVYFLGMPNTSRTIMVLSGLWQTMGYSAIVYLSALTSVDVNLYEAAMVDGANRFDRLWHITLPGDHSHHRRDADPQGGLPWSTPTLKRSICSRTPVNLRYPRSYRPGYTRGA